MKQTETEYAPEEAAELTRVPDVRELADRLLRKLDTAISQLDQSFVTQKIKTRDLVYGDPDAKGKPTREVIREEETLLATTTLVDQAGLKQLTAALKELQAITGQIPELDRREREEKLRNLEQDIQSGVIEVVFAAGPEEWNG